MADMHPIIKKLQFKDQGQEVLVINAPKEYDDVQSAFKGDVHHEPVEKKYNFIQIFGTTNEEIQLKAKNTVKYLSVDGLLWLCYPKKSSKKYKGSNCSRDTITGLLKDEGFEPVRQVAIDEDWSASCRPHKNDEAFICCN